MWWVIYNIALYAFAVWIGHGIGWRTERARHHMMMSAVLNRWLDQTSKTDPTVMGPIVQAVMEEERHAYARHKSIRSLKHEYKVARERRDQLQEPPADA